MYLPTDEANLAEYHAFCVTRALKQYNTMRREGYNVENARAQAIAYLRRKTAWTFHLAAGAFDAELREHCVTI